MAQQELDRLWEELQRVEKKIEEREAKLEAATTNRDSAVIQKGIDRLVVRQKGLDAQLSALQAQLAGSAGRDAPSFAEALQDPSNVELLMKTVNPPPKRARTGFGTDTPQTITLGAEDVEAATAWKLEVEEANVPCAIAKPDDLLEGPSLREDLRYLLLLLDELHYLDSAIADLVTKRFERREQLFRLRKEDPSAPTHLEDLETPYHPVVLAIFRAASRGQQGLFFLAENQTSDDKAREDIRGMIQVLKRMLCMEPSEVKARDICSPPNEPIRGIHRNRDGLGKVLKCVKVHCLQERQSPAITLGTLVSRCEFIWFMQLRWELHADGQWKVKDVRVAPEFPEEGVLPVGQLVRRTDWENIEGELGMQRGEISFRDFMLWANQDSTDAPPGFRYLSRYADTLARIHDLPITPVQLTPRSAGSGSISLEQAEIVARGRRSIIIRLHPGDEYVVKIGRDSSIETEHRMHQLIDREKCQYLRAAVPGMVGTVEGAGAGLSFIGLELYCDQISRADLHADAAKSRYMEQAADALSTIHKAKVLHRDLKPDNLLIKEGKLIINDYDVSCEASEAQARRVLKVGAPAFRAPRLDAEGLRSYDYSDDWASLGLTFANLLGLYNLAPSMKTAALQNLCSQEYVPELFKRQLQVALRL